MIVDLDIGNTRIKWRAKDGAFIEQGAFARGAPLPTLAFTTTVERVRVVSVVGGMDREVSEWARRQWHVEAEFARVESGTGGVVCGYHRPEQLGVDRWLAILAARRECTEDLVVVSCGTALTVDRVDGQGRHLGGYIAPGLGTMYQSLGQGTWGVRPDADAQADVDPGRDTVSAVANGCLTAALGVVRGALSSGPVGAIFITGGDGPRLLPFIEADIPVYHRPALVLDGLDVALP